MYKYPTGKIYRLFLFLTCLFIISQPQKIGAQETILQAGLFKTAASGITLNAQSHDFGNGTAIGDTALWGLEIISSDADTLDIDSIVVINSMNLSSSVFSISTFDTMLASGDTLRDTVLFIPQASREYVDSVKIYSNASGNTGEPNVNGLIMIFSCFIIFYWMARMLIAPSDKPITKNLPSGEKIMELILLLKDIFFIISPSPVSKLCKTIFSL